MSIVNKQKKFLLHDQILKRMISKAYIKCVYVWAGGRGRKVVNRKINSQIRNTYGAKFWIIHHTKHYTCSQNWLGQHFRKRQYLRCDCDILISKWMYQVPAEVKIHIANPLSRSCCSSSNTEWGTDIQKKGKPLLDGKIMRLNRF